MSAELQRVVELGPGIFQIASDFDGRWLHQHLFVDGDETLLLDAGTASTVEATIEPALAEIGVDPARLSWLVVTHPDVDHQGGAAAVRSLAPECRLACGFLDVAFVSDPEIMLRYRYRAYAAEHGLDFSASQLAGMREECGARAEIDATFAGGEVLQLGSRRLEFHHVPGHAAGHLAVRDAASGEMFMADAVHGRGSPSIEGGAALPPTYEEVDAYLATIASIKALDPPRLHSGHMPAMERDQATAFLEDSARFVRELDDLLVEAVSAEPATLEELCDAADQAFGPFDAGPFYFMFTVHGHLRRLVARGRMRLESVSETPRRYVRA